MVSSLRFGTRLTSQSGGEDDAVGGRSRIGALRMKNWYAVFEDDAEGGRSWVATLRVYVLVMKLKLQRRTQNAKEAEVLCEVLISVARILNSMLRV